jgi:thiamine-monophosphate kinase
VVGGDTTRGPLNLAPTVFGEVPQGQALTRAGAQAGDDLWVSGTPGLAALGLAHRQGKVSLRGTAMAPCLAALDRPQPRVALGLALRGLASGRHRRLRRPARRHRPHPGTLGPGGRHRIRLPAARRARAGADAGLAQQCLLAGGDDYELAFSAPPARRRTSRRCPRARPAARPHRPPARRPAGELILRDEAGRPMPVGRRGFDHFA